METVIGCVFFYVRKPANLKQVWPEFHNKLFTNLASSSRTGEYWPSVGIQQILQIGLVPGAGKIFQYGPLSRAESIELIYFRE